jgi:hypothetical protein
MVYTARTERCDEVDVMQNKSRADQKISDAELIALVRKAQQEFEAQAELNEVNLLLRDFAKELLQQRLFLRVKFSRIIDLSPTQ